MIAVAISGLRRIAKYPTSAATPTRPPHPRPANAIPSQVPVAAPTQGRETAGGNAG